MKTINIENHRHPKIIDIHKLDNQKAIEYTYHLSQTL